MKKTLLSTTGLLVALVLFLTFNVLSNVALKSTRLDLTENRLYTLSDGSKNILANLNEDVRLRFYFSKKIAADLPGPTAFAERVQELLEEYVAHSKGKLSLEVADPVPFSEEEDRAVGYGLQGVPATAAGELLYFGLAGTNTVDQEETIPFFQDSREQFLEYDITKLVFNLSNPKKHVVGLMTSLPMEGNPMARMQNPNAPDDTWYLLEQLRQLFEVRTVPLTSTTIGADIDVLMVVHPQGITPESLYAIDQFVLGGGKALVFVDPHCEVQDVPSDPQNPMAAMMADRSSSLEPLLSTWGLEMTADDLAGDREAALRVGFQNQPVEYLVWLGLRSAKNNFNKDDFVTSQLDTLNLASAGVLKKKDGTSLTVLPLIESSTVTMRVKKSMIQFGPDPARLLESFVPTNEKFMLAARVNGNAMSAYPDGKPKPEATPENGSAEHEHETAGEHLKESKGPINVIVVADADMLEDRFWTRMQNFFGQRIAVPTASNADFAINAVDNLSGSNDLISLRSRGRFNRPFDRVTEIRREADTSFRQKEKELEDRLRDTEQKIAELQSSKDGQNSLILSPEQQKEIEGFRDQRVKTRKELRKVKHEMQKDIEDLGTKLKFVNIGLIPAIVIAAAIGMAALRTNRLRS